MNSLSLFFFFLELDCSRSTRNRVKSPVWHTISQFRYTDVLRVLLLKIWHPSCKLWRSIMCKLASTGSICRCGTSNKVPNLKYWKPNKYIQRSWYMLLTTLAWNNGHCERKCVSWISPVKGTSSLPWWQGTTDCRAAGTAKFSVHLSQCSCLWGTT